jgi:hypothetical protein
MSFEALNSLALTVLTSWLGSQQQPMSKVSSLEAEAAITPSN